MKRFRFALGNVKARKGHRQDCAQVAVVIEVVADNAQAASVALHNGHGTVISYHLGSATPAPVEVL